MGDRAVRTRYFDFTVKHFHEALQGEHGFDLSYTWTKTVLQSRGLVRVAPKQVTMPTAGIRSVFTFDAAIFCRL